MAAGSPGPRWKPVGTFVSSEKTRHWKSVADQSWPGVTTGASVNVVSVGAAPRRGSAAPVQTSRRG